MFFKKKTSSTVATSGAPEQPAAAMNVDRTPWQRITLSFIGIAVCLLEWRWATAHLYSLPPTSVAAFTTITVNNLYVVGALVVFFVTGRLVYEWKASTANQLVSEVSNVYDSTKVPPPKNFDDLAKIP